MMAEEQEDFPFEEIRDDAFGGNGDYFTTIDCCIAAGFDLDQIWSVTEEEDVITHGPSHHYVNLMGYVCTNERHDGKTYYHYDAAVDIMDHVAQVAV